MNLGKLHIRWGRIGIDFINCEVRYNWRYFNQKQASASWAQLALQLDLGYKWWMLLQLWGSCHFYSGELLFEVEHELDSLKIGRFTKWANLARLTFWFLTFFLLFTYHQLRSLRQIPPICWGTFWSCPTCYLAAFLDALLCAVHRRVCAEAEVVWTGIEAKWFRNPTCQQTRKPLP